MAADEMASNAGSEMPSRNKVVGHRTYAFVRGVCHRRIELPCHRRQRGATVLIVAVLLYLAMAAGVFFSNKHLLLEKTGASQKQKAVVAREAAEAGIDWAWAMLNDGSAVNDSCEASKDANGSSFRDRYLAIDPAAAQPALGRAADQRIAGCTAGPSANSWSCSCPPAGSLANVKLVSDLSAAVRPYFAIGIANRGDNGAIELVSSGCGLTGTATQCAAKGTVQMRVTLMPLPDSKVATQRATTYTMVPGSWRDF